MSFGARDLLLGNILSSVMPRIFPDNFFTDSDIPVFYRISNI